ncbi:CTD small phosphatase-like protein [Morus notabilis]|uniref:CTD small phosphatase-like protein n=1 Tax=Morus notabilis TaxID=981085 RepID=W9SMG6_9ROSA|nr:carboxy-terminal domain RNA polymerase II polypeptide A small phosphatase 1 [Morus notabilis]EXC51209.1 CTD small phosphatase-like protein [Morus notabilis]
MVSKIVIKRTPTKSIKDCRSSSSRRHRRKSPAKKAAAAVLAAVNKSIFTCHKRLIKIFSKLAQIGTPNRNKGYNILKKTPESDSRSARSKPETLAVRRSLAFDGLLPPPTSLEKRTVFLDLDETLVHSQADPPPERFDFVVRPRIDGEVMNFYVLKRPGVDELLEWLAAKYEVVVFTAGLREYASLVIDRLDRKSLIAHRLYRDACKEVDGRLVKDLSESGRDLRRVVIVDDNPNSYSCQPENAVPVRPFVDDLGDRELGKLVGFFEGSDCFDDMRDAVRHYLAYGNEKLETLQL